MNISCFQNKLKKKKRKKKNQSNCFLFCNSLFLTSLKSSIDYKRGFILKKNVTPISFIFVGKKLILSVGDGR